MYRTWLVLELHVSTKILKKNVYKTNSFPYMELIDTSQKTLYSPNHGERSAAHIQRYLRQNHTTPLPPAPSPSRPSQSCLLRETRKRPLAHPIPHSILQQWLSHTHRRQRSGTDRRYNRSLRNPWRNTAREQCGRISHRQVNNRALDERRL